MHDSAPDDGAHDTEPDKIGPLLPRTRDEYEQFQQALELEMKLRGRA